MNEPWRQSLGFDQLADAIASDRLIIFTGAGISNGLVRDDGNKIGGWKELLEEVANDLSLSAMDQTQVSTLLGGTPRGPELIEAATMLESADPNGFDNLIRTKLTPATKQSLKITRQQKQRHSAVMNAHPRGIVTLNIDRQHVKRVEKLPASQRKQWLLIDPTRRDGEQKMGQWLRDHGRQRFLLEAHGSLDTGSQIVFSHRAYRELLAKNPTYSAFLDLLFSSYRFLFLGFGLTDLDFDQFIGDTALKFGTPPQLHVAIRKSASTGAEDRQEIHYSRRFGIQFLNVDSYDDVWAAVDAASRHCGKTTQLAATIKGCISKSIKRRQQGHRALAALGFAGKSLALSVFHQKIADLIPNGDTHKLSEYIYSLKYLATGSDDALAEKAKRILFDVLRQSNNTELIAHAVTAVEDYLQKCDLKELDQIAHQICQRKLSVPKGFPDRDDRCPVYLEAAILRLRAKYLDLKFPKRVPLFKRC